jgi:hypothetical protein
MGSSTDNTTKEWRDETSPERRGMMGSVRYMAVKLTEGATWQVLGHLLPDAKTPEARQAQHFSGIGFFARPAAGANAEAVVVFPGGASNPIIVATRDEDARKAIAELPQNSTAMFNRLTIVIIKPDGTVEIRASGGTASPLATKADIDALKAWAASHTHVVAGITAGGAAVTSATPLPVAPVAAGTTVLKAQ